MNANGIGGYQTTAGHVPKVRSYDDYVRERDKFLNRDKTDSVKNKDNFFNRKGIDDVTSLGKSASDLYSAADRLNNKSLYNSYRAESSDSSYVEADSSGRPTARKDYTIEVDKLATGQTNEGASLSEDGAFAGAIGRHSFEIGLNGRKHTLSVDVSAGDTNERVLRKVANTVNDAGIGVKAWVSNNDRRDTSRLVFQSEGVGDLAENKFSVSDLGGGSLVADTGIANTAQAAQDAVYTVNNRDYTSRDNEVSLGNGIDLTLKRETRNPIEISVKKDTSEAVETAHEFVNAYNKLLSDSRNTNSGDTWLNRYLDVYASSYSGGFKRSGIIRNNDGSLSIDKKALQKAAENGSLERLFEDTRASYGPANRIMYIAKNVQRDPIYATSSRDSDNNRFMYSFGANRNPYIGSGRYSLVNLYF